MLLAGPSNDREAAALKIQAIARGRAARKATMVQREDGKLILRASHTLTRQSTSYIDSRASKTNKSAPDRLRCTSSSPARFSGDHAEDAAAVTLQKAARRRRARYAS